jgi:hypothetical protein
MPYKNIEAGKEPGPDPGLTITMPSSLSKDCIGKVAYIARIDLYERPLSKGTLAVA